MRHLPKPPWPLWIGNGSDDGNLYPAGVNLYNATPRIVAPTGAEMDAGLIPSRATIGAQQHNWLFSRWSGLIEPLIHGVLRSFRGYLTQESIISGVSPDGNAGMGGYSTFEDGSAAHYTLAGPLYTNRFQKPMLQIVGNNGASFLARRFSSDGHHWHSGSAITLADGAMDFESFKGSNPDDPNRGYTIHVSDADDDLWVTDGTSLTASEITNVAPAGHGFGCVRQAASGFLLGVSGAGATTSRIFSTYPDAPNAGTFTTRSVPAGWNTTTIHNIVATGDAGIAGDTETILACGNKDEILVSHDSGQTWSAESMPFGRGGWDSYQIAWSPTHQVFMAVNSDFKVAISETGDSWSVAQSADLDGFITSIDDRGRLLACSGPCFAMAVNRNAMGTDVTRRGVMYTFDLSSWFFVDFGLAKRNAEVTFGELLGIREWAGGFVAFGSGQVWVSPSLYVPDPETLTPG